MAARLRPIVARILKRHQRLARATRSIFPPRDAELPAKMFYFPRGIYTRISRAAVTREQQAATAKQVGLYTAGGRAAAPGTSQHEFGLAYDLVIDSRKTGIYEGTDAWAAAVYAVGSIGEKLGLFWGFRFSKPEHWHFQVYPPPDWREKLSAGFL